MKWLWLVAACIFAVACLIWFAQCSGSIKFQIFKGRTRLDVEFSLLRFFRFRIPSPSPRRHKPRAGRKTKGGVRNALAMVKVTHRFLSVLRRYGVSRLRAHLELGGDAPARTAMYYGVACAVIPILQVLLDRFEATVVPVFSSESADLSLQVEIKVRLGVLLVALVCAAREYRRVTG